MPAKVKVSRKKPVTPNSLIRDHLRRLWLRCRERSAALKATGYCCTKCGAKNSKAAGRECLVEVHHAEHEPNWERIFRVLREELLQPAENLMPLCVACHDAEHSNE